MGTLWESFIISKSISYFNVKCICVNIDPDERYMASQPYSVMATASFFSLPRFFVFLLNVILVFPREAIPI